MVAKAHCRVGDTGHGVCNGHSPPQAFTATVITGCNSVLVNNQPSAIQGSRCNLSCGHQGTITEGSGTTTACGQPRVRVGDHGVSDAGGSFIMDTGSSNVFSG